jgi:hypothetical protein
LDLKEIGRVRLTDTLPLKWIYQIHWILFGQPGLKERELTGLKLGFRPPAVRLRLGMDASDVSEGLWATAGLRRSSARRGELGSVVVVEIRFQREVRKVAGGASDAGDLWPTMLLSFGCKIG